MDGDGSIDPADLYSMDDYLQEREILDDLAIQLVSEMQSAVVDVIQGGRSQSGPRRYVDRPRERANQQLMDDYFSPNPVFNETQFRRRFRMRRPLFEKIVEALSGWSEYFTLRLDALNRPGFSPIHKCTVAIRQLAYGGSADQLDEYLKIGESTGVECLKMFAKGIIEVYGQEYLRRPTVQDVERLLEIDGIYPEWAVFVKSIRAPQSAEHKLFAEHQEGARKDVECAFGILQSRFHILRRPARLYEQGDLENIMKACIILHNMIIEDERDIEDNSFDLNEEATTSTVQQSTITQAHEPAMEEVCLEDDGHGVLCG
ncbi:uncharacterized protein LOC8075096 [Sorghum bicolor]|uniref:uncharacterized protein LOC8075096 n=1 Tax=Sorghum bicolor TaxID=4558 RepID=UPI000B4269E5|nr:uncharacterized protein LOC8075096 [Sorghum bicolor]|eukprot:XP_002439253.2 uncharacterized protein LOC8075096 [Sorghum bicolor]